MKLLYSIILIAIFANIPAQNPVADSLLLILKQTKSIDKVTKLQNQISEAYQSSDADLMQKYARLALQNSRKDNNNLQQAKAYQNIGISYIVLGEYQEAVTNFNSSEKILINPNNQSKEEKEILAKTLGSKGVAFSEQNNYAEALDCDLKAIKIYEEFGNRKQLAKIYNNVGVIYRSIGDQQKALKYFFKANHISWQKDETTFAASSSNIGMVYLNQNHLEKAKKYFDQSFRSYQKNENPRALGEVYNNYAVYYSYKDQPEIAKENLKKAEKEFLLVDDKFGLSETYLFLAQIFFGENKFRESLEYANKGLDLANELDLTESKMNAEKLLSQIYDQKGNQKLALFHLKNYDQEKGKFEKIKNEQQRLRTELSFQYEKSQLEKKDSAEQERLKLILGFVILICILGGIFFYSRNREKQQKILLQKQLAELEHKALHLQMNPHFVFNCLAAISSFIMQNGKVDAMKYLSKFSKLMRLTLEFSKESAIPIDKEIEALQNYLELEQLRFNQKFDFKIDKDFDIEDDTAIPTLLLQPYVENAIIHGVAPKDGKGFIKIDFSQKGEQLICTIEDDGVGIESSRKLKKNSVHAHKSMALEISKKRLETLGKIENKKVNLEIEELKNENGKTLGTRIRLKLPLNFIKN